MSKVLYERFYNRKTEKYELIPRQLIGDNGALYRVNSGEITTSMYTNPKCTFECDMIATSTPGFFAIKKVHFNDPATIVLWADGTKTVVKCGEEDIYDPQTGLLMCMVKKMYGNTGKFNDILREWVPEPKTVYMGDVIDYILGDAPRVISQYIFGSKEEAKG